ncbi:MAG: TraR/DksA family transcriptional regulator [Proteobacteria bacterium]|nr:TraR/DksA family transcriptional regulator [Pseudomonadota bacterium]
MADQFDLAQDLDAIFRQQALAAHARRWAISGASRRTCIDCDEQIPEARRKILPGCTRCIDCATFYETNTGEK